MIERASLPEHLKGCCCNDPGDGGKTAAKNVCVLCDALIWVIIVWREPKEVLLLAVVVL